MAESEGVVDHSPTPDSISEAVVDGPTPTLEEDCQPHVSVAGFVDNLTSTSSVTEYLPDGDGDEVTEIPAFESCSLPPRVNNDLQLPSAFRPFVSEPHRVSPVRGISPTTSQQQPITSTPLTRRSERLTIPGTTVDLSSSHLSQSPSSGFVREGSNHDDDDGRTTASAPPCTPAPESHAQAQSPFRNNRQIKRIDLLAMSRSRQSDRAENARRDGRLAPSPRKKDEVLRNSGFLLQPSMSRGFGTSTTNPGSARLSNCGNFVSPERLLNGSSSTTSPNVDVVSIDEQNDESKYIMSIQFHDFERGEQMMKCNLCGFVTNNQKFYRRHRRLHNRPYHNNQIYCNQCDYSTSQVRRMREHSMTHQPINQQPASTSNHHNHHHQHYCSSNLLGSGGSSSSSNHQQPHQYQNPLFVPNSNMFPSTTRPLTLPVGATAGPSNSNMTSSSFGLHPFIPPSAQDHPIQVNTEAGLQPPPRGPAMLGNYEGQVANYMRTVITNLMSPTRSHTNNSVTSSTLYHSLPPESHTFTRATGNSNNPPTGLEDSFRFGQFWNHSHSGNNIASTGGPSRNLPNNTYMKVKLEPRPAPISQVTRVMRDVPSSTQLDQNNSSSPPRRPSDMFEDESGLYLSSDDPPSSPIPEVVGSRAEARISTDTNMTDSATQGEGGNISDASCSIPFVKMELPSQSESFVWPQRDGDQSRSDRGVQCNIISMSGISQSGRTQSETVSSAGGVTESKCYFCGITFDDEVLYTIHIGCHSHTDPFLCNVCGKQCRNKYGFYSHIMRGHQSRQNS